MQGGQAGGVRLDLLDLVPADAAQPWHSIHIRPGVERVEPFEVGLGNGDDELSALVVRKAALRAVLAEQGNATCAQLCFEAARCVVDAGMDDTGVVARLMHRHPVFLLHYDHACPWPPEGDLPAYGEPDDSGTDHPEDLIRHGRIMPHVHGAEMARDGTGLSRSPGWREAAGHTGLRGASVRCRACGQRLAGEWRLYVIILPGAGG